MSPLEWNEYLWKAGCTIGRLEENWRVRFDLIIWRQAGSKLFFWKVENDEGFEAQDSEFTLQEAKEAAQKCLEQAKNKVFADASDARKDDGKPLSDWLEEKKAEYEALAAKNWASLSDEEKFQRAAHLADLEEAWNTPESENEAGI